MSSPRPFIQTYCSGCGEVKPPPIKTLLCGRCRSAWFCSKDCQTTSWRWHKKFCKADSIWAQPPPEIGPGRLASWKSGLVAGDLALRRSSLTDLQHALTSDGVDRDVVGHLGLLPLIADCVRHKDNTVSSNAAELLDYVLDGSKMNCELWFLAGGTRALANMVLREQLNLEVGPLRHRRVGGRALTALIVALEGPELHSGVIERTLSAYAAEDVLVPRVLVLMTPPPAGAATASPELAHDVLVQNQQATRLLKHCITLQSEVPVGMWKQGFGVVKALVDTYSDPSLLPGQAEMKEERSAHVSELLQDIVILITGFVDHFVGAVDMIVGEGLPDVILKLLHCPEVRVREDALGLAKLVVSYGCSQETLNTVLCHSDGQLIQQAVTLAEQAVVEGPHLDLLRASLLLLSECFRADPSVLDPHVDRILHTASDVLSRPSAAAADAPDAATPSSSSSFISVFPEAMHLLKQAVLHLHIPKIMSSVLTLPPLQDLSANTCGHTPMAVLDFMQIVVEKTRAEGVSYLLRADALVTLKEFLTRQGLHQGRCVHPAGVVLRAMVLADESMEVVSELRADKENALKAKLSVYATADKDFAYLAGIICEGKDPKDTPVFVSDWMDLMGGAMGQLGASRVTASERWITYLTIRKEAVCGASGRAFEPGEELVRLSKCSHWFTADEMKTLVLRTLLGEVALETNPDGPWPRPAAEALKTVDLRCPVCSRSIDPSIRD